MAATIRLVTFSGETVAPVNDAIVYDSAIGRCGVFYGCDVTISNNVIYVDAGYGMIRGRFFEISASSLPVTLASSGTLSGRLYIRLDLSNTEAPIQLLTVTGSTLPSLTQETDANFTNGIWEMEMATFTVTTTELSDLTETYAEIEDNANLIDTIKSTLGKTYTASKSTNTSVSASSYATICTLSLPAGVYVLTGHVRFASIPQYRTTVAVGTGAQPGGDKDGVQGHYSDSAASSRNLAMQTAAIVTLTATTTVYLSVYSDSAATVSHGTFTAVRIK